MIFSTIVLDSREETGGKKEKVGVTSCPGQVAPQSLQTCSYLSAAGNRE